MLLPSIFIGLLAQVTSKSTFIFSPPLFWLVAGVSLCLAEFFLPKPWLRRTKFISLMMGVSALIVSLILWRAGITLGFIWQYIMYDGFNLQVLYWMGLSLSSVIWIRPMFFRSKNYTVRDATEAITLTDILPGQTGRVLYEGSSWQAFCENYEIAIAPNQKVYVLRIEGNTLIVAPEILFHS
ncbi:NfeD family protein [Limnofasciculus baicalensis]|uniref:NfeD family protein n=1 Tax=Limnofasciculus baicalensis TaxID=3064906 RepID=UPI002815FB50|nr:NfeD family protein [Limnofasciculus baicalensis]